MRKYDKKFEESLITLYFDAYLGKFVCPIDVNYPETPWLETMLFEFLNYFGKKKLLEFANRNIIKFEKKSDAYDYAYKFDSEIRFPCRIDEESFSFPCGRMNLVVFWDYGHIDVEKRLWTRKTICISKYRFKMFHSDGTEADVSGLSDEQIAGILDRIKSKLNEMLESEDKLHEEELNEILD